MLGTILHSELEKFYDPNLLVGNETADDAAVYDLGNGTAIISTTDFFMPIVDDPFDFGRIAATNAISDIFAMGGKPIMGIAILGFPTNVLPAEVAQKIVDGGRFACHQAGIALAGGHSIDSPEPIFGLAVTGVIDTEKVKRNASAKSGCKLYMTKPIGIGILTTAEKKGKLKPEHQGLATAAMCQMNSIGSQFSQVEGVTAMTDVTGFGLLGHLKEMSENNNISIKLNLSSISIINSAIKYASMGVIPKGLYDNKSFVEPYIKCEDYIKSEPLYDVLFDPQTSGGLAICVDEEYTHDLVKDLKNHGCLCYDIIGKIVEKQDKNIIIA